MIDWFASKIRRVVQGTIDARMNVRFQVRVILQLDEYLQ
jgi:hypothetical protein